MEGLIGVVIGSILTYIIFYLERKDKLRFAKEERVDKFKLAAIDKKLEVYQTAFKFWIELSQNLFAQTEKRITITQNAYEFWKNNCLYLDEDTRNAFRQCISYVNTYDIYLQSFRDVDSGDKEKKRKELYEVYNQIVNTGNVIIRGLGFDEFKKKIIEVDAEGKKIKQ